MVFSFPILLAWALGAFFVVGAFGNGLASPRVRDDYRRWGYPAGFHRVTAALELVAAILLFTPGLRLWGAALAAAIMLAAIVTLLRHSEYKHALVPTTVLALVAVLGALSL